jgi:hypothetical protein
MACLHIAAMDVYVNNFVIISHLIQHVVAPVSRQNQRLVLRIFTGKSERGETDNWLHPFALAVNILNPTYRFNIADRSQIPLCGRKIRVPEDDF